MRYRAGVIGCGRIGFEFDKDPNRKYIATHTGAYNYVKDIELVAVCDIDKKRLKGCMERWNIPAGYSDLKEMLKRENLDILSICTLSSTHYPILKEAGVDFDLAFCPERTLEGKALIELRQLPQIVGGIEKSAAIRALRVTLATARADGGVSMMMYWYWSITFWSSRWILSPV